MCCVVLAGYDSVEADSKESKQDREDMRLEDVPVRMLPLLRHLSIYLHTDPILFAKLCRILAALLKQQAK